MTERAAVRVAAAVLVRGGRVLLARRPAGKRLAGLWEFPGGKLEAGESPADALRRELKEELGLDAAVGPELARTLHDYDFGRIELIALLCRAEGEPRALEHDALEWALPADLPRRALTPADAPLAERLARGEWDALLGARP
ncbi:MAG: (deoxy)nucleoside triphosphate pyrophosphohydrolase [Elusimicrobia bacterium]|nr:(deoxy)nucleoside triphosphate pyrophosphohydrolase [Elusimicrobiota bacterium]